MTAMKKKESYKQSFVVRSLLGKSGHQVKPWR